jgi:hypothetical protein
VSFGALNNLHRWTPSLLPLARPTERGYPTSRHPFSRGCVSSKLAVLAVLASTLLHVK